MVGIMGRVETPIDVIVIPENKRRTNLFLYRTISQQKTITKKENHIPGVHDSVNTQIYSPEIVDLALNIICNDYPPIRKSISRRKLSLEIAAAYYKK